MYLKTIIAFFVFLVFIHQNVTNHVYANHESANCQVSFELPVGEWKQIGLPCNPPSGESSVAAILGDELGSRDSYGETWVLYAYSADSNSYRNVGYDGLMKPGMAYWIINLTGNRQTLTMPINSVPADSFAIEECPDISCLETALDIPANREGSTFFTMVSIPSSTQFLWTAIRLAEDEQCTAFTNSNGEVCTLSEASEKNLFLDTAWKLNGTDYDTVRDESTLLPWEGLWVQLLENAQSSNRMRLLLPVAAPDCRIFPPDNPWNQKVVNLPVHPNSDAYMNSIGLDGRAHADFGTVYNGAPNGIPTMEVNSSTPLQSVAFLYADESDTGPYPIPENPAIEGGNEGTGDRHIIMLNREECQLYELFYAWPPGGEQNPFSDRWYAGSGAIFNLHTNELRPDSWTSADAAGLPIYPGLVKYKEAVIDKNIKHALRFTVVRTQRAYIHPATHFASASTDPNLPPMGLRVRLKQEFDISGFSEEVQVILTALKEYGMFLADNGSNWFISGAPDPRWNDDNLSEFHDVPGSAFEAVYTGELIAR